MELGEQKGQKTVSTWKWMSRCNTEPYVVMWNDRLCITMSQIAFFGKYIVSRLSFDHGIPFIGRSRLLFQVFCAESYTSSYVLYRQPAWLMSLKLICCIIQESLILIPKLICEHSWREFNKTVMVVQLSGVTADIIRRTWCMMMVSSPNCGGLSSGCTEST